MSAIPAQALDGHHLGNFRHQTGPVTMLLQVNYWEEIRFHILEGTHFPLVLDYPWLSHHNRQLNGELGEILGWGADCHRSYVVPVPALRGTSALGVMPPDLAGVLEQYHDLAAVFSKARATSLPPHRLYNCTIDLLPGTAPPKGRLYSLSELELKAMEEYICSSLSAGLIWPFSSPIGVGFFFVEKKDKSLRPCIDYRRLNEITMKNWYPLPLVALCTGHFSGLMLMTFFGTC